MINLSAENGRTGSDEEDGEHADDEGEDGAQQEAPPLPGTDLVNINCHHVWVNNQCKEIALIRNVKNNDRLSLLICITISIYIFENFEKSEQFLKCLFLSLPLEQTRIVLR